MADRRSWHPGQFPAPHYQQMQAQHTPQYGPVQARGEDPDDIPVLPPMAFLAKSGPAVRMNPPLSHGRRARSDSPFSFECEASPSGGLHLPGDTPQFMSHSHVDLEASHGNGGQIMRADGLGSLPAPKRRNSDADVLRSKGVMACPKCSKEFPEDQTEMLLSHIDACKD